MQPTSSNASVVLCEDYGTPQVPTQSDLSNLHATLGAPRGCPSIPHVISSLVISSITNRQMYGNTTMKRKISTVHKLMVDVTSEKNIKLVDALINIIHTNQELKRSEIEVNLQIHNKQMHYKHQNGQIEEDNAKLSLLN